LPVFFTSNETETGALKFPVFGVTEMLLRVLFFGQGDIAVERQEIALPETAPGAEVKLGLSFTQTEAPIRMQFDVLRPKSFSAHSFDWKP
jgi:hypothetical protein